MYVHMYTYAYICTNIYTNGFAEVLGPFGPYSGASRAQKHRTCRQKHNFLGLSRPLWPTLLQKHAQKHCACRQIRPKPPRKHCACPQIHFEALSRPLENTAPADKSGSIRFENTAPVHKSTLRLFHSHSKPPRLCTNPSFEPFSKSFGRSQAPLENTAPADKSTTANPLSTNFHRNGLKTQHLCTNLSFEVAFSSFYGSKTPLLCTNPIFRGSKLYNCRQIRGSKSQKHRICARTHTLRSLASKFCGHLDVRKHRTCAQIRASRSLSARAF